MSKRNKIILFLVHFICILIIVLSVVFGIWVNVKYGGKPIDEIPSWVLWLMWR